MEVPYAFVCGPSEYGAFFLSLYFSLYILYSFVDFKVNQLSTVKICCLCTFEILILSKKEVPTSTSIQ